MDVSVYAFVTSTKTRTMYVLGFCCLLQSHETCSEVCSGNCDAPREVLSDELRLRSQLHAIIFFLLVNVIINTRAPFALICLCCSRRCLLELFSLSLRALQAAPVLL